ncbi:hypothetical protein GXM_01510 [Nostoc sphaeroides CCNUC1]|uniref:Uncharacterized protein n=2 Tax=Nostoc sphaeroides TaxID=446679 RepID=A0A5P8VUH0_9NOSO|nr:hypothetical protein GXM_01510 [Nostoc sphaeroides CCNUC1]
MVLWVITKAIALDYVGQWESDRTLFLPTQTSDHYLNYQPKNDHH